MTDLLEVPILIPMNKPPDTEECARILKSLGDQSRLQIVRLLLKGERNVTEIVQSIGMAQPQVSHHLSILRSSGLVETRREGNRIINFIKPEIKAMLSEQKPGLDLGCCSIQFDEPSTSSD